MHEMAIAESVLGIAFGEMDRHAAKRLNKIKISIGEFSGVVKEALEFALNVITPNTRAAGSLIEIEVVPLKATCPACGPVPSKLSDLNLICPTCRSVVTMTSGREMTVDYLDFD